jgi:hypothetical protein
MYTTRKAWIQEVLNVYSSAAESISHFSSARFYWTYWKHTQVNCTRKTKGMGFKSSTKITIKYLFPTLFLLAYKSFFTTGNSDTFKVVKIN